MAGSKSNYYEDAVLNVLRNTGITAIAQPYVGLFTTAPSDTGPGTEVTGNNYARATCTFGAPSGGSMSNSGIVQFNVPSASWGTIVGWGVFDASTNGNMLYYSDQTPNKTINSGDDVQFDAGALVITET